jgi:hypothetical protein
MIEYLDRLSENDFGAEVWLVRVDGQLGNAQIYFEDRSADELSNLARKTRGWIGFAHPHVTPILDATFDRQLVVVIGDERGPTILQMTRQLTPAEREAWALHELLGVADGVSAMARGDARYIHRHLDHLNLIVGADGHVRLRAPIAELSEGPRRGYVGRGRAIRHSWCMSPEQVCGQVLTPASDVFQLAYIAYAALTQRKPFVGVDDFATLVAIKDAVPPPLPESMIGGIPQLIVANLARLPEDREPTVASFAAKLRGLLAGSPYRSVSVEPTPQLYAKVMALRHDTKPAPHQSAAIMGGRCAKTWDELTPTKADGIRHCESCRHEVVHVRSLTALIPLLGQRCVAYEPED